MAQTNNKDTIMYELIDYAIVAAIPIAMIFMLLTAAWYVWSELSLVREELDGLRHRVVRQEDIIISLRAELELAHQSRDRQIAELMQMINVRDAEIGRLTKMYNDLKAEVERKRQGF